MTTKYLIALYLMELYSQKRIKTNSPTLKELMVEIDKDIVGIMEDNKRRATSSGLTLEDIEKNYLQIKSKMV